MTTMSLYQARTHLSKLLDQVAEGKTILITRKGKPAAVLGPPPARTAADVKHVVAQMLEYRDTRKRALEPIDVRDLIEERRRY
ncbi:MAG: type II toxin-antitoxin system prevent-host-death family antitoxin [Planctomycetaceae bacterium]|nr:type II toxin-antitoxin system prevent-host-death family antitoxin [Planctomycetaceae bacterium]